MKALELVEKLSLQPHPEGGWYREIHRAQGRVQVERGSRSAFPAANRTSSINACSQVRRVNVKYPIIAADQ